MRITQIFWKIILLLLFIGCSKNDSKKEEALPIILPPTVITLEATDITENNASIEGNVSDDGGGSIIEKGVCWATTNNPTLEDNHTQVGSGIGRFVNQLIDLEENTTYYVRAYASNEEGTSFGNEISFTTLNNPELIYEGYVTLLSQEMVDDFGDQNYTEITGDLTIAYDINHPEWELVHNLDKLSSLTKIGGKLGIYALPNLSSADGLANISTIGGDIEIKHSRMTSLVWLKGVQTYNGSLILSNIEGLQSLEGLENCTKINQGLNIYLNRDLIDINALKNLTSVGWYVNIQDNEKLPNIDGLSGLKEVGRYLSIYENHLITDISGLKNLNTVGSMLSIEKCPILTNINGLDNLNLVEGVEINDNDALTNLDGLEHILSAEGIQESLSITNNSSLINIDILELLTEMPDFIEIRGNESLKNLNLDNLETIGFLDIGNNSELTEITGLNNLISITKGLNIGGNDNLTKISGFENISSFEGSLKIWYNEMLSDLCWLAPIFESGLEQSKYQVSGNNYNPSYQDIIDGQCSN